MHSACTARTMMIAAGMCVLLAAPFALPAADSTNDLWYVPAFKARQKNPVAASAASISAGKVNYEKECLTCHGTTGRGDGPGAKALKKHPGNLTDPKLWDQTDGALFFKVTVGRNPMPSFREKFTDQQRWQAINYVRTLTSKEVWPELPAPESARRALSNVLTPYLSVESALADGQLSAALGAATKCAAAVGAMASFKADELPEAGRTLWASLAKNLGADLTKLSGAADLAAARKAFGDVTFHLQTALRKFGHAEQHPVYMSYSTEIPDHKAAMWLHSQEKSRDPYVDKGKPDPAQLAATIYPTPKKGS